MPRATANGSFVKPSLCPSSSLEDQILMAYAHLFNTRNTIDRKLFKGTLYFLIVGCGHSADNLLLPPGSAFAANADL